MRALGPAAATLPRAPRLQSKARTDASERHETAGGCDQGATLGLGNGALRLQSFDCLLKVDDLCSGRAHGTLGEAPLGQRNETDLVFLVDDLLRVGGTRGIGFLRNSVVGRCHLKDTQTAASARRADASRASG